MPDKSPEVPDDVWERFLRDSEQEIRASAPKEPSARARMVTERLRQLDEEHASRSGGRRRWWRRSGDDRAAVHGAWRPEGWRTAPAGAQAAATRRRRLWGLIGVPLAVAVAVVVIRPSLIPGDPFGAGGPAAADSAPPLPAETARPTGPPSAAPGVATLAHPFAGSPAERWADGADGIVVPEGRATGAFSARQVAGALAQTKKLLVAANLDPATLRGEHPTAALAVLDPRQPKVRARLEAALRDPSRENDPLTLFSRFDPREVRPAGDVVKLRGRMTFRESAHESVTVHADYTFVYPLVRPGGDEVARTIVRRVLDLQLPNPAHYRTTPGRLTLLRNLESAGNSACEVYDGFLHPRFGSGAGATGAPATGPTADPYDRSRDLDPARPETCGTVTRT
ncbi:hypothetical protein [Streptomyces sp. NPDC004065]|uniref:hypothetical protein n=1 Tax=Streptomyces sp. NPDC004065 TaxID=3364689 RepID=UPI00384FF7E7